MSRRTCESNNKIQEKNHKKNRAKRVNLKIYGKNLVMCNVHESRKPRISDEKITAIPNQNSDVEGKNY